MELSGYLSRLELERLREERTHDASETHLFGSVLFVDVSGFTPITETLAKQGPRGAERLSEILNDYYGRLTAVVDGYGGDILFFAGDAAIVLFRSSDRGAPSGSDAARAASACALEIMRTLDGFSTAAMSGVKLSLRAAVGAGALRALRVGEDPRLTLITGSPFRQIASLSGARGLRGVAVSREAHGLLQGSVESRSLEGGAFEVTSVRGASRTAELPADAPPLPDAAAVESALPEVVVQRIHAGQREFLAEFRTLSVVFVGLGGTSQRLADVHAAVTALGERVRRFGGAVYQFLEDDKGTTLVVSFGVPPKTHEDDAARAALFATEAREALAGLGQEATIGVATGRLFCGAYGGVARRQYSLVGPTINRAARLMQAAGERGVLCDEATRRAGSRHARFESLGAVSLKGLDEPVPVSRALVDLRHGGQGRSSAAPAGALVGRVEQRALLVSAVRSLSEGESAAPILLVAEAGMGKSHLLGELRRIAEEQGASYVQGDADAMETGTPYYALRAPMVELLGIEGLEAESAKAHILEALAGAREFLPMAPLLGVVLPFPWAETPLTQQMTPQIRAENLSRLLLHVVRRAAAERPFLLVLEDAHWFDSASWSFVGLVRRLIPAVTLVLTLRPMDPPPADYAKLCEGATQLKLPALDREQTVVILQQRLGAVTVPHAFVDFVDARAEGNPFYIEEIAFSLRDSGRIRVLNDAVEAVGGWASLLELSFPGSLEAVITSRIDRLAADEQLALKIASVVGRHFEEGALEDAHPVFEDRKRLPALLSRLEQVDLIYREGEASWVFRHALTRETTYGLLSYSQRRSLHQAVAEHLERRHAGDLSSVYARLANHFSLAENTTKACAAYGNAAEQSLGAYANEEAITFFTRALDLDDAKDAHDLRRARWLKLLGDAHYSVASHAPARAAYEAALRATGIDPPSGARGATAELARHLFRRARQRLTGRGAHRISGPERERLLHGMQTVAELGAVLLWKGDRTSFLESAFMHRNMADFLGPCGESAAAMSGAGYVLAMMGLHRFAERDLQRAVALAETDPALLPRIQSYVMQGMFMSLIGRPEEAVPPLRRAGELADELGGGLWKHRAKFMLGEPLVLLGSYEEAARAFEEAAVHSIGAEPTVVGFSYAMQALSRLRLGDVEAALTLLEGPQGIQMIRPTTVPLQLFASLGPLADARLSLGDLEGALIAIREGEAVAPGEEANGFLAGIHGHAAACRVYLALAEEAAAGRTVPLAEKDALAGAARAVARFRRFSRTFPGAFAAFKLASGRLAALSGNGRTGARDLDESARAAHGKKMPYEEASAHYYLARVTTGERRQEHLRIAGELFERFGMKRELERVQLS